MKAIKIKSINHKVFIFFIVITSVAFIVFIYTTSSHHLFLNKEKNLNNKIEYYMNNIQFRKFDNQGNIEIEIFSDKIKKNSDSDVVLITDPKISYYNQGVLLMNGSASNGKLSEELSIIELSKNVSLQQKEPVNLLIESDLLSVDSINQLISTNNNTLLKLENNTISALSMKYYYKDQYLKLRSNVRVTYVSKN